MFTPIPEPLSTDDLVSKAMGLPTTAEKVVSNPTAFLPGLGIPLSRPTQEGLHKPITNNTLTAPVVTEDSVLSLVSKMDQGQAENFMHKLTHKLLFAKYKTVIKDLLDTRAYVVNPVINQVLCVVDVIGDTYVCSTFSANYINNLDATDLQVSINNHTVDTLRDLLIDWTGALVSNYLKPYSDIFEAYTKQPLIQEDNDNE